MSKAVDEILNSILEEFSACRQATELEAKALYRLLNYCPPPAVKAPTAARVLPDDDERP
jgi:hypothetical protein